jgi:hypothetical protein
MAKYRHRIFEMYDFRDEAVDAVTPRSVNPLARPAVAPTIESWDLAHLSATRSGSVVRVQFDGTDSFGDESVAELRADFAQLAENLGRDSKLVLDFTGVKAFSPAHIDAIALLGQRLQTKGSRIVLCCLAPAVRDSFFDRTASNEAK